VLGVRIVPLSCSCCSFPDMLMDLTTFRAFSFRRRQTTAIMSFTEEAKNELAQQIEDKTKHICETITTHQSGLHEEQMTEHSKAEVRDEKMMDAIHTQNNTIKELADAVKTLSESERKPPSDRPPIDLSDCPFAKPLDGKLKEEEQPIEIEVDSSTVASGLSGSEASGQVSGSSSSSYAAQDKARSKRRKVSVTTNEGSKGRPEVVDNLSRLRRLPKSADKFRVAKMDQHPRSRKANQKHVANLDVARQKAEPMKASPFYKATSKK